MTRDERSAARRAPTGAAAAIAADRGLAPRAIDIAELQALLRRQGVFLRASET